MADQTDLLLLARSSFRVNLERIRSNGGPLNHTLSRNHETRRLDHHGWYDVRTPPASQFKLHLFLTVADAPRVFSGPDGAQCPPPNFPLLIPSRGRGSIHHRPFDGIYDGEFSFADLQTPLYKNRRLGLPVPKSFFPVCVSCCSSRASTLFEASYRLDSHP